ncbi:MAG: urease accessory protein UreD [Myxacorys chilensis ATA2-1-KO14]|nr:urease accessory protein UreD [Myxacorys chilensis ATA2-1-KO14]
MNQLHSSSPKFVSPDWHGTLFLKFANRNGATVLTENLGQAPLKVQRPFYPEGDEVCHGVIMHTAGGIVGGDRLSLDLRLHPNSRALITTPAAARIYRTNGREARQTIEINVDEGAVLEWLPQDTIVFDGALYRQDLRINLAPNAHWIGWDMTRFGRTARGERFTSGMWRSHTEVWQQGRPLWIDRQWLPGHEAILNSPHGLAGCPVVGSFAYLGQPVNPDLVQDMRLLWSGTAGETGVTRLQSGLLCRYRGASTIEMRQWFIAVWRLLRETMFDRSVCIPRVWQL